MVCVEGNEVAPSEHVLQVVDRRPDGTQWLISSRDAASDARGRLAVELPTGPLWVKGRHQLLLLMDGKDIHRIEVEVV